MGKWIENAMKDDMKNTETDKKVEKLERALKVIAVWASVYKDSPDSIEKQFEDIKNCALKALDR